MSQTQSHCRALCRRSANIQVSKLRFARTNPRVLIQPVSGKMRLEMVIGIQNRILEGESWGLFSNDPYEMKSVMTIEDLHFVDHVESRFAFL